MKSIAYIESLAATSREDWIAEYRALHAAAKAIDSIYRETCTGKPADTIAACYKAIGEEMTKTIIATYVISSAWDGRISFSSERWAKTVTGAWDEKAADRIGLYCTRIHMAHLDQLAREIIKIDYKPA